MSSPHGSATRRKLLHGNETTPCQRQGVALENTSWQEKFKASKAPPVGLEGVSLTELSANELRDAVQPRGTESGTLLTRVVEQPEADAGLRLLTEVWGELPDSVRNRILMLADESLGAVVR